MGRVLLFLLFLSLPATAAPILPAGEDSVLDVHMARHARQFYHINALPFGLSLDAHAKDEAAKGLINQFLAQDVSDDFAAVTGAHPYEVLASFGEYGDLGFFGGIALAGTAYEYITLKREGAPEDALAEARARVVRAAETWHLFKVITGGGGLVARGLRLMEGDDPEAPPLPATYPEMVPLFDEDGAPLPQPKNNGAYRWDNSGGVLPEDKWIWKDSCSKDQLVGQVFAMAALHDAMKDDPDIDQALVETLAEDARLIGEMLMTKREISQWPGFLIGAGEYDLIIMDADTRPTYHHDLNPYSMEKVYLDPAGGIYNLFNLMMAVGVIKGLHHVSGDPALEAWLYEELLDGRDFLGMIERWRDPMVLNYIYAGVKTNFDNPDMTSIALWLALYHENDPDVSAVLREFLEEGWWQREGESHTARLCKQPLWHAVYLTLTDRGTDPELVQEIRDLLKAFDLGPYWNVQRINCDEAEIAAGECLAVDGETTLILEGADYDGDHMSTEALDPSIRPPSNFDARSNPFDVNGGGGNRLNPGGDLLASYWVLRAMDALEPGETNISPFARDHMPVGGWPETPEVGPEVGPEPAADVVTAPDAPNRGLDAPTADSGAEPPANPDIVNPPIGSTSSGCTAGATPVPWWWMLIVVLGLISVRTGFGGVSLIVAGRLSLATSSTKPRPSPRVSRTQRGSRGGPCPWRSSPAL